MLEWAFHLHAPEQIRDMAQFRLGSHWLEVQRGRCTEPRLPRHAGRGLHLMSHTWSDSRMKTEGLDQVLTGGGWHSS